MLVGATSVSADSFLNCSFFNRSEVPAGFASLINVYQLNNSHAEYGNLTGYNWTVACKSSVTALGTECSGVNRTVANLYNNTNAHVSADSSFSKGVCFNMSAGVFSWSYSTSNIGATPADYECVFSVINQSDSHVYECDNPNATYNINLRIEYSGCVELGNATTYQDKVVNNSDGIWLNKNLSLCNKNYSLSDLGAAGAVIINASNLELNCNSSLIIGSGTGSASGTGIYSNAKNNLVMYDCNISSYWKGLHISNSTNATLRNFRVNQTTRGIYAYNVNSSNFSNINLFDAAGWGFFAEFRFTSNNLSTFVAQNSYGGISLNSTADGGNNTAYGLTCRNITDDYCLKTQSSGTKDYIANIDANDSEYGVFVNAANTTLYNITISNYGGYGLFVDSDNVSVRLVNVTNAINTAGGEALYISTAERIILASIFTNNTRYGIYLNSTTYSEMDDVEVNNATVTGVLLDNSNNNTITNVSSTCRTNNAAGRALSGLNLTNSNNNTIFNSTFQDSTYGIFMRTANNNTVYNTTITNNSYGLYLISGADNLFYYNNFTISSILHAYAGTAGNDFNTTNGTACGANCSRGNYWDDILNIDIYDTGQDGYGDNGTAYPYNSTNGGNVSANVVDWGPATNQTPPINGSIIIVGPNGTEITGTRNVFLNLTYSTRLGVGQCRWANDNSSNLNNALWENCTTVKAWILSESEGNKTVYYQISDLLNKTATFNDSITYRFTQDYTAPTAPTVYDGLYDGITRDIDWWNSNTTLSANWVGSREDISNNIKYRYRILENNSCYNNDCNFTSTGENTSVTVTGLSLKENWVYSFEVQAYNNFELINSTISASNGTRIDITKPNRATVNSTTHPNQQTTYAARNVELNWTATDVLSGGNRSGVEAYSYILDSHPGTAPDENIEERYWETVSSITNNGYSELLRADNTTGAPNTNAVFKQILTNLTQNESIRVRVALAETGTDHDDLMGVKVYLMKVNQGAAITTFSQDSNAVTNIVNISQEIKYAENLTDATIYVFNLTVNETVNDVTKDIYVVVSGLPEDNNNRKNLSIAGSTEALDPRTASYLCNSSGCANVNSTIEYAIEVKKQESGDEWRTKYSNLGDGTYYFHVRAKDRAGNWGDTEHYKIIISGTGVSVAIASPTTGEIFITSANTINISVKAAVNSNASVKIIAKHPDGGNHTSSEVVFSTTNTFENITLELGRNEIYAVANTSAGIITTSSSIYVIVSASTEGATNKTLRVVYAGGCTATSNQHLCYKTEGSYMAGLATETDGGIAGAGGYAQADTEDSTIKIFLTKTFNTNRIANYLDQNEFLDLTTPSFAYGKETKPVVIQNELRYEDISLDGTLKLTSGKYSLKINHNGVTGDGMVNLSIALEQTGE
jgi:parallel beta-helix repeat protein